MEGRAGIYYSCRKVRDQGTTNVPGNYTMESVSSCSSCQTVQSHVENVPDSVLKQLVIHRYREKGNV